VLFVFDPSGLVDASPSARALLGDDPAGWAGFRAGLQARFPGLPDRMDAAVDGAALAAAHPDDRTELHFARNGKTLAVHLRYLPPTAAEHHRLILAGAERDQLVLISSSSPNPCWRSDGSGRVLWTNTAYRRLANRMDMEALGDNAALFRLPPPEIDNRVLRRRLDVPGQAEPLWYDVRSVRAGTEWMHYATDVGAVVQAETAQRNFVQSLTRIFAELATGLAVFDRDRRLVMFNPALVDLTSLPVDFLSRRPSLNAFFDTLRDRRIMPEPRDYTTWRQALYRLFDSPAEEGYFETWALPSGLTYRVTARPSPDGAVAFLFEDITSEITLARRYRAELELGQAVLDHFEDAVAVFSPMGNLTLTNEAYRRLWKADPEASLAETTLACAMRDWQAACKPGIGWATLHEAAEGCNPRGPRRAEILQKDGQPLSVQTAALSGGAFLVTFRRVAGCPARAEAAEEVSAGA